MNDSKVEPMEEFKSNRTNEGLIPDTDKGDHSRSVRPNPSMKMMEIDKDDSKNVHIRLLSEIPKNNRQSDRLISELELNEAEDFVFSDREVRPSIKETAANFHGVVKDTP
jgi:hypothetical protein